MIHGQPSELPQVSIVVSSYDGLSDCWMPFFHGLGKYWPSCPYPIFLITNEKDFVQEQVTVIKTGVDLGWSRNLLVALDRIKTPYILYFQEDYWINETVNAAAIADYVVAMERNSFNYVRLLSFPRPDGEFPGDARLGIISDGASYRTSVQASIWRTQVLRDLVDPTESPWQFEINGTERSRKYGGTFLSVMERGSDPYYYGIRYLCTAVNRGRWSREAWKYAEREGISVDFSNFPTETWWHDYQRSSRLGSAIGRSLYRIRLMFRDPALALRKLKHRLSISE